MMYGGYGFGTIGMILNAIITLAIIVGLVILIVWAVRRIGSSTPQAGAGSIAGLSAKEITQQRYARGEIDREQYQQILSDLSH